MMDNLETNVSFCCAGFIVVVVIIIGGYYLIRYVAQRINNAKQIEKARNKCAEYVELACKFPSPHSTARIMDGTKAVQGEFPHQVLVDISMKANKTRRARCGGSIVSERFVLTAAHCIFNPTIYSFEVKVGTLDAEETNTTLIKSVRKTYKHPANKNLPLINDLALLELEKNLEFNSDVRPICLNTKLNKPYEKMIASGWGITKTGDPPKYLNKVELHDDKEADKYCRKSMKSMGIRSGIIDICLAHLSKGINQGDSGGPLQVKYPSKCENTWEQIGITSAVDLSNYTGKKLTASLFVKVDYYLPWIASVVWPD